jgi:hypothetical protein
LSGARAFCPLPPACCRGPFSHVAALQFGICFQRELKLSGRMPDRAGNMPALPFNIHDSQC